MRYSESYPRQGTSIQFEADDDNFKFVFLYIFKYKLKKFKTIIKIILLLFKIHCSHHFLICYINYYVFVFKFLPTFEYFTLLVI